LSSSDTAIEAAEVSTAPAKSFMSGERRSTVLCLLLVLLTLALYNPVVHNGFTNLDDDDYIVHNAHVSQGLTWSTVKWACKTYDAANWHPLTWLSHALDYQVFKLNPAGHHYGSVLLHATNAVLLFLLLEGATSLTWPSLMVAALFALHPVNVESVAWAAERKNVLSMLFFLLAMHAYGWYVRRGGVKRYGVVAALFALGLMAKSEIITLPFVLLLWDYWPLQRMGGSVLGSRPSVLGDQPGVNARAAEKAPVPRSFSFLFLEKVPLLLLAAASAVITMVAQRSGHALRTLGEFSSQARFGNVFVAYVRYLGKAFWPSRLAALYPLPSKAIPIWQVLASAATLILLTGFVIRWRNHRYLPVGWFWLLGTLVPVIGIIQVGEQTMADRYAYLSYVGLFFAVVWGVAEIARARKIPAVWIGVPAILILLTLGAVSRRQIAFWHDSETLWRHALSVTEDNYRAHDGLARALAKQNRPEEAIAEFNASQKLRAYNASAVLDLGIYEQMNGHLEDAIEQYARSFDASPDSKSRAAALSCEGLAWMQMGDFNRAKMSYAAALQQSPDNGGALIGSGLLAERDGDLALAVERISRATEVDPTDLSYLLLAQALRRAGRAAEADHAVAHAQRISHDLTQSQKSASEVLAAAGIGAQSMR
jgi:tetratricopeptide (TPR) repeat protein